MREVAPAIIPIACTTVDNARLQEYLDDIGANEYECNAESDLDKLIEIGGKVCYRSFQPGMNANVSRVREDNREYLANINKMSHGSVREHGSITFVFANVSRVFTHELVRHRVGCAISQESLRFVRLTDLGFWIPPSVRTFDPTCDGGEHQGEGEKLFIETVKHLEKVQQRLAEIYEVEGWTNFAMKKKLTSMFRRLAPIGLATSVVWTANVNTLRHVIQARTSPHAEEEIRVVFDAVGQWCVDLAPNIFGDLSRVRADNLGQWICKNAAMPYDQQHLQDIVKAAKKACKTSAKDENVQLLRKVLQHYGHID